MLDHIAWASRSASGRVGPREDPVRHLSRQIMEGDIIRTIKQYKDYMAITTRAAIPAATRSMIPRS